MTEQIYDVAIVGAGLSGLTCAKALKDLGYQVVILEKSRGVGGRVATRRLQETWADHGLPYLSAQGSFTEKLLSNLHPFQINQLSSSGDIHHTEVGYVSPTGINTIAKELAVDLEIRRSCRVVQLTLTKSQTWQLDLDDGNASAQVTAKSLVLAIPAPQAFILIEASNLNPSFLADLASVEFAPCLAVMAGYEERSLFEAIQWQGVRFNAHPDLAWVSLEHRKNNSNSPVVVIHSTPSFAQTYLDAPNLDAAGQHLLARVAEVLFPQINSLSWFQVHRWRYAIPQQFLSVPCLVTNDPLPLICCGDWCGGQTVEHALDSGQVAADQVVNLMTR